MSVSGKKGLKWVLKVVPVANGYDVYSESPILAFYRHAKTQKEAEAFAATQPTTEDARRMLVSSS